MAMEGQMAQEMVREAETTIPTANLVGTALVQVQTAPQDLEMVREETVEMAAALVPTVPPKLAKAMRRMAVVNIVPATNVPGDLKTTTPMIRTGVAKVNHLMTMAAGATMEMGMSTRTA